MNRTLSISVIALIAIVMVVGIVSPAMAKEGNNGSNGCEKSGNAKACENNPNSVTCQGCIDEYNVKVRACGADFVCANAAHDELKLCVSPIANSCQIPPPPGV